MDRKYISLGYGQSACNSADSLLGCVMKLVEWIHELQLVACQTITLSSCVYYIQVADLLGAARSVETTCSILDKLQHGVK